MCSEYYILDKLIHPVRIVSIYLCYLIIVKIRMQFIRE
jgi:hypothetical protein